MNDNTPKTCTNCKYFSQYYVIAYDRRFKPAQGGFCSHLEVKAKTKYTKKNLGCELWQPYELKKLEIQYSIEERLQTACKNIEDCIAVLRDVK